MSDKLPADFDPDWYSLTYPDVEMTGMSPEEHFLLLGQAMGRRAHAGQKRPKPVVAQVGQDASAETRPAPPRPGPIIDAPAGFEARPVTTIAANAGSMRPERFGAPGAVYSAMMGLGTWVDLPPETRGRFGLCGGAMFRGGAAHVANAWYSDGATLRLMFEAPATVAKVTKETAKETAKESADALIVRAYQADPAVPGEVLEVGDGVSLPDAGPAFLDIALINPLAPVLLELTGEGGDCHDVALLAFPSLLPGGYHGAELKALQTEANPMDAFWSLSNLLLQEFLGAPDWPALSLSGLVVSLEDGAAATGAEPIFSPDVQDWLAAVFGLAARPGAVTESAADKGPAWLREALSDPGAKPGAKIRADLAVERKSAAVALQLPADSLPTISALVSRRLEAVTGTGRVGPFLVAEFGSLRPRWSVALPPDTPERHAVPVLGDPAGTPAQGDPVPVHLSIAYRPAAGLHEARMLMPQAPDAPARADPVTPLDPLSVLLDVSDLARTQTFLQSLKGQDGLGDTEVLVRLPQDWAAEDSVRLREILDESLGQDGWRPVAEPEAGVARQVLRAGHELVLSVSDRVVLHDTRILSVLCNLMRADPKAASVSCVLLAETVFRKATILQPASGGLFPSAVSFASSPRLGFNEPDVMQALPDMTYPVVANTFTLALLRKAALSGLPRATGPVPASAADIRLGLDLIGAGHRSLCTARVRAGLNGSLTRRDAIDPVAATYLQPRLWEEILTSVTVLRELF